MRVVIINNEHFGFDHLQSVLSKTNLGVEVIGEFKYSVEAIPTILQEEPDLVIMNLEMPYITGLEMARLFSFSSAKFLILSNSEIEEFPKELDRSRTSIILKPFSPSDLKKILTKVQSLT
ncbi:MAG: response regulator [Saprospirales bacterium]|nr:MAG: response regulator [Saprospirales bacterium]